MDKLAKIAAIEQSLEQLEMSKEELIELIKKILEAEIESSKDTGTQELSGDIEAADQQEQEENAELEALTEQQIAQIIENPEMLMKFLGENNIDKINERVSFAKNLHNIKKLKIDLELRRIRDILDFQGSAKLKNTGSIQTQKGQKHLKLNKLVNLNNYIEQKIEQKLERQQESQMENTSIGKKVGRLFGKLQRLRDGKASKILAKTGDNDFDPSNNREDSKRNNDDDSLLKDLQTKNKNTGEIQAENKVAEPSKDQAIDAKITETEAKVNELESKVAESQSNITEQKVLAEDQKQDIATEVEAGTNPEVSEDAAVEATDSKAVSKKESIKTKSSLLKLDAIADRQDMLNSAEMGSVKDAIKNMGKDLKAAEQNKDLLKDLKEQKMRESNLSK